MPSYREDKRGYNQYDTLARVDKYQCQTCNHCSCNKKTSRTLCDLMERERIMKLMYGKEYEKHCSK
jgi:hypothetical protein